MNKKKIMGIILIVSMIFNVGCTNLVKKEKLNSKEIVFEENVLESSNNVKITQEEVNFIVPEEDTEFVFRFYTNGKIYGEIVDIEVDDSSYKSIEDIPYYKVQNENIYMINDDFVAEEMNTQVLVYNENEGYKGINSNCYGENQHGVNYYNYETNELRELYRKRYSDDIGLTNYWDGTSVVSEKLIEGNDKFGYSVYNYVNGNEKIVSLQIFDLDNEELYEYELKGTDINFIIDIIYDRVTEKFYAISNNGIISSIEFVDNIIKLSEVVELEGVNIQSEEQITVNNSGDIILMNCSDIDIFFESEEENVYKGEDKYNNLIVTYKPINKSTNKVIQSSNRKFEIVGYWPDYNICILSKERQEYYIGEFKGDRIDIYNKIELDLNEYDNVWLFNKLMNEDNTELLLHFKANKVDISFKEDKIMNYAIKINIER